MIEDAPGYWMYEYGGKGGEMIEDAPGYWMYETGGQLKPAMLRYLDGKPLSTDDVLVIRLYLQQWVDSPVWDANPHQMKDGREELRQLRELARLIRDRGGITRWVNRAIEFGVDPI